MKYAQRRLDRSIFRAYDIRGIVGSQLNEDAFYTLGRALAQRLYSLDRNTVFVARDCRLSSEGLCTALTQGLLDSGIAVTDLGEVSTPMLYFATATTACDCGLMVTGSHNPAEYNGLKMVLAGKSLVGTDIDSLYALITEADFTSGKGFLKTQDIFPDYKARIVKDIVLKRPLKVVVDCGNGVAGATIPLVLRAIGCEVIELFCEVDGRFPNHHPDPTVEANLEDLKQAVLAHKADLGIAFDGDADRLGVVTEKGRVLWPDRLMMFYARALLSEHKGATIVFDVKCSSHLERVIKEAGGIARMCPTGHSIVKSVMKETKAILAGEMSGHIFFKDRWYGFDDALYSACRLLEIVSVSALSLGEQFEGIPDSVNTPEIKIPMQEEHKFQVMACFAEAISRVDGHIIRLDGVRVEFEYGWGLLRASNTTPCLVARFEAINDAALERIQRLFEQTLQRVLMELGLTSEQVN